MLIHIAITNLATIEQVELDFAKGTSVITGETGAGKSILIDAIELALGKRAGDVVRQNKDKADISLTFDISALDDLKNWLNGHEFSSETNECIIRRTIHRDGKTRSYINGIPTTLQFVREAQEFLINIHGQHENQVLFKTDKQRLMLDNYGHNYTLASQVNELYFTWQKLSEKIINLKANKNAADAQNDFLRFQLKELQELNVQPDEYLQLEKEHKQLANSDELLTNLQLAAQLLTQNESQNASDLLNKVINALEKIQDVDSKIPGWLENLRNALMIAQDTENELQHYLENIDLDPERLQWIENRIGTLIAIARKYKINPEEILALQDRISDQLSESDSSDERIAELEKELAQQQEKYLSAARDLSAKRERAAKKLSKEITTIIHELALPHGKFHVNLIPNADNTFAPYGLEKVSFEISTNPGMPLQPLTKVASGGELSRISLAIHMATAGQFTIPTLIFDEVDVGISGGVAEIVGKLLRKLGATLQLVCITHSPQVAAQGHHHLLVEKFHEKNLTFSHARFLNEKEKIQELARLLGGVEITKKTIARAKEMREEVI